MKVPQQGPQQLHPPLQVGTSTPQLLWIEMQLSSDGKKLMQDPLHKGTGQSSQDIHLNALWRTQYIFPF